MNKPAIALLFYMIGFAISFAIADFARTAEREAYNCLKYASFLSECQEIVLKAEANK